MSGSSRPVRTRTQLAPIPKDHLISPLEGRVVAGSMPQHYFSGEARGRWRWGRSRVNPMAPVRALYGLLISRNGAASAQAEGWCVDV